MTRSRERKALRMTAWMGAAVFMGTAAGWMLLGAKTAETAPAPRPDVYETAVGGPAGGFEADLRGIARAALVATRAPDGGVSVDCTDPETASAMVYGGRP